MKDPAFLFYSQDFIVGVQTMTFEERGQYITLLAMMHQQGRLEEKTIRFLVGSISDNLKSKFEIDENGFWFNNRLEKEIEKRKKFTESRVNNGKLGGRPKEEKKPIGLPLGYPTDNLIVNENENENENINKKIKIVIPSFEEFEKYALSKKINLDKQHLKLKFDSWIESDWTDGKGNKIKNWKSKLLNTIPFLKESTNQIVIVKSTNPYNELLKPEYR